MSSQPPKPPRRLFASSLPPAGGDIVLDPAASAHARVLRLREGDPVCLFDGRGKQAIGRILQFEGENARCEAEPPERLGASRGRVVLVQCLPKANKLDVIVRMTTELGVSAIHLAASERTVPLVRPERIQARQDRLERVAKEAARQSGYENVPAIVPPAPLSEVAARSLEEADPVDRWVLLPGAPRLDGASSARAVWLVVGPEGGLTQRERDALHGQGFKGARMAVTTLRVETAAPVAVALALDRLAAGNAVQP